MAASLLCNKFILLVAFTTLLQTIFTGWRSSPPDAGTLQASSGSSQQQQQQQQQQQPFVKAKLLQRIDAPRSFFEQFFNCCPALTPATADQKTLERCVAEWVRKDPKLARNPPPYFCMDCAVASDESNPHCGTICTWKSCGCLGYCHHIIGYRKKHEGDLDDPEDPSWSKILKHKP